MKTKEKGFDKQTARFLASVSMCMPKLSNSVMQRWINNPTALAKKLQELTASIEFKVWKTIKLGTGPKTADDFRRDLAASGNRIGERANDILGKSAFTVAAKETEIDLVVVSVSELGFKNGATREQIYARAKELGLDLCPAEVGPQLRLQYADQPMNKSLLIGMEPIIDSRGDLEVFHVVRLDNNLRLLGHDGDADFFWGADDRWVFARPRN